MFSILLSIIAGCSQQPRGHLQRVDVTAKVTLDGQPLNGVLIDFTDRQTGEAYGGTLDAEGCLSLKGVAVGIYTITLQPASGDPVPEGRQKEARPRSTLARQFLSPQTSPLAAKVTADENHFTYELREVLARN
ncbi:hypothetical protein AB1L30_18425 [Bremerella sp. JC817]|uniref:carboxypeptidase-like regulatory domain-containing protein n=1 Tax=Bremerella sp. JC817 TaxID=3231756 RepID=UPI00345A3D47